jgi:hypothetical protein
VGVAVVAANLLGYEMRWGLGWMMVNVVLAWGVWLMLPKSKRGWGEHGLAIVASIFAVLVGFRANGFVQSYNIVVVAMCTGMLTIRLITENWEWSLENFLRVGWKMFIDSWRHGRLMVGGVKVDKSRERFVGLLRMVTITGVLLVVFGGLLGAADAEFAKQLQKIFDQLAGRVVMSTVITVMLVWWLSWKVEVSEKVDRAWLGFWEIVVPVGLVAIMVGAFLGFQTKYLFASHQAFAAFPESYSEYVRKGFFELLIAVTIGGILAYVVWHREVGQAHEKLKMVARVLNGVWLVEIGLLLVSAYWRDQMYIQVYGFTRTRLIGEGFLVWLAGILLAMLVTVMQRKLNEKILLGTVAGMTILVGGYFNGINMDMKIVSQEPKRFMETDYFYLANLSSDGVEGWEKVINGAKDAVGYTSQSDQVDKNDYEVWKKRSTGVSLALKTIKIKRDELVSRYKELGKIEWREFNWSDYQAYKHMTKKESLFFTGLDALAEQVDDYEDIYYRGWILHDFEYPFVDVRLKRTILD